MNNMSNAMNDYKKYLYNPLPLKILSFLSLHLGKIFTAKEISEKIKSSRGGTNQALRMFLNLDILSREQKGNIFLYKLNHRSVILKQFKLFDNLLSLYDLIKGIQPYCYKIVLFGSYADGSNTEESDIDLFIKTRYKDKVRKNITKYETINFKVSAVIQDPLEIASARRKDKEFFDQVNKGIVLWEGTPEYEEI